MYYHHSGVVGISITRIVQVYPKFIVYCANTAMKKEEGRHFSEPLSKQANDSDMIQASNSIPWNLIYGRCPTTTELPPPSPSPSFFPMIYVVFFFNSLAQLLKMVSHEEEPN
ncbi:hypothetical protein SAY87_012127 [Trapa incisa]|uniref:Uncharacterized protein n=1 Tax=Trapa incisa TaxID=236973 RepID=A0AAN7GMZ0_9MYRT|nr:hypothetical protein SAY87_012127 [Trapa incisa]